MKKIGVAFILFVCMGFIASCVDSDTQLKLSSPSSDNRVFNSENKSLLLYMFRGDIHLIIHGGDGHYTIKNYNEDLFEATLDNHTITLVPKVAGNGRILIEDGSQHTYILYVWVGYEDQLCRVLQHEVFIEGKSITPDDKKQLEDEIRQRMLVDEKGMYIFKYMNPEASEGLVHLYSSGPDVPVVPFKRERKPNFTPQYHYMETVTIQINEEEYVYDFGIYNKGQFSRAIGPPLNYMFVEDVTDLFKEKYPAMEKAYGIQVLYWE